MNEPVAAKFLRAMICGLLVGPVLGRRVPGPQPVEGGQQVAPLLGGVARLAQLVAPRIAEHRQAVPEGGLGVVAQPGRCLHDVGVGVVDDPALGVGHVTLPSRLGTRADPEYSRVRGPPGRAGAEPGRRALCSPTGT